MLLKRDIVTCCAGCKTNLHYPCAKESGWQFSEDGGSCGGGRNFFCVRHRKNSQWQAVHAGGKSKEASAWPNVPRPPGRDFQDDLNREEKRRRLLPSLVGPGGVPIWLNCRPSSLIGLPLSTLRSIASDSVAAALVPEAVLRSLPADAPTQGAAAAAAGEAGGPQQQVKQEQVELRQESPGAGATEKERETLAQAAAAAMQAAADKFTEQASSPPAMETEVVGGVRGGGGGAASSAAPLSEPPPTLPLQRADGAGDAGTAASTQESDVASGGEGEAGGGGGAGGSVGVSGVRGAAACAGGVLRCCRGDG